MKATVRIRKASACLMSFDAPTPANDVHEILAPIVSPSHPSSPASVAPPTVGGEPENTIRDTAQDRPDLPGIEDRNPEIETIVAAAVEAERQAAGQRLRQAREDWTIEITESLAARFEQNMARAIDRFREDVAGVLTPFVSQEVCVKAIDDLATSVKKALDGVIDPVIEISAPADVINKLSRALTDRNVAIIARESDQMDARIHCGSTTIETALESLLARLASGRRAEG